MEWMADVKPKLSAILKGAPLFAALTDAEIQSLAARTVVRSYGTGEALFRGRPLRRVIFDRVRSCAHLQGIAERAGTGLGREGPGASIAELPVFDGGNYPASAAVVEPAELLFLSRKDFRNVCLEHPEVALKVLQVVGRRLRRLVGIIEELSFTTVRHRLISWLLRQARTEGVRGPVVLLSPNQQELASQIGTVRELVSRNLARLQAQGFISISGREVTILDQAGLEADLSSSV
jgi:CRP-like cAMP-binding protein